LFSATVNDSIAVPDSDSFAVLVFSWSPEQGVRARCLSMESLGRALERTLTQEQEMPRGFSHVHEHSIDYGISQSMPDDRGQSRGPSISR
jgi:hypothetical protein